MNLESLREHLAIKVLGAKVIEGRKHKIYDFPSGELIYASLWNPPENIEQAMGCLDTLSNDYTINKTPLSRFYECWLESHGVGSGWQETLPLAISLACAKATGWEE